MHIDPLLPPFVATILAMLMFGLLLRYLKQPQMLGYLIAGVVLGPHVLGLAPELVTVQRMGELGVTLLLFFIGMEISPRRLAETWKVAVFGTLFQIFVSVSCIWLLGSALGWPPARSVLLGFVVSLSSTAVVLKLLKDRGEMDTPTGQDVLAILLAQDLAIIPMLITIGVLGGGHLEWHTLALQIGGGGALIGFVAWLLTRREVHLPFARQVLADHELQVFAALIICFGLSLITGLLELSTALGAFVAGIVVTAARETEWVHRALEPFRIMFVAVFFVSIGMLIDLRFVLDNLVQVFALVAAVLVTNTFINAVILKALGLSVRRSLYAAALLAQIGEFSFVLAAVGLSVGIIAGYAYQLTIAVIAISLLLSPPWIALFRALLFRDEVLETQRTAGN